LDTIYTLLAVEWNLSIKELFRSNTIVPALVAKHFLPMMPRSERSVFAALTARVDSISDKGLGGWHAYRASKAALNRLVKKIRHRAIFLCPTLYCVPPERLFDAALSAGYLLGSIDGLSPDDSGRVCGWAGKLLPA